MVLKATRLGFEPRLSEPKSEVLPLHYRVIFFFHVFCSKTNVDLNDLSLHNGFENNESEGPVIIRKLVTFVNEHFDWPREKCTKIFGGVLLSFRGR